MTARLFSSDEVCRAAAVTYRQLDYWTRCEVLIPTQEANGSGTQRRWSAQEVDIVAVVGQLSRLGAGVVVTGIVAETLRLMGDVEDVHGIMYVDSTGGIHPDPCAACWCIDLDAAFEGSTR